VVDLSFRKPVELNIHEIDDIVAAPVLSQPRAIAIDVKFEGSRGPLRVSELIQDHLGQLRIARVVQLGVKPGCYKKSAQPGFDTSVSLLPMAFEPGEPKMGELYSSPHEQPKRRFSGVYGVDSSVRRPGILRSRWVFLGGCSLSSWFLLRTFLSVFAIGVLGVSYLFRCLFVYTLFVDILASLHVIAV
jgi:hypothetical protein